MTAMDVDKSLRWVGFRRWLIEAEHRLSPKETLSAKKH